MKKSIYYFFAFALLLLMGSTSVAEEVKKTYTEEYKVNPGAMLKVANKYGSIDCRIWDRKSVKVDVVVTVEHSRKSKAESILDKIDIKLSGNKSLVECVTEINNLNCSGSCEVEIDYTIMVPSDINVDLYMKYGQLRLENITGEAKLGVKYGDLEVNTLTGNTEVYLGYSDADINELKNAMVDIKYSDIEIEKVNELNLKTRYSEIEIGKVYSLLLNSNYDEVSLDHAFSVDCSSDFSDLEIGTIEKDLIIDINYGELEVNNIKADFNKIEIYSEYADTEIDIDDNANFTVEAYSSYCDIDFDNDENVQLYEKSHSSSKYKGYVGKNPDAKSSLYVKCKHADVSIK